MHAIVSKSILTGLIAVIYHDAEILWNIFKTPLFWYTACAVFVYANNKKRSLESYLFIQKIISNKWRFLFLILLFLIASIALPVIGLKGGIIPERYVNAVICFTLILLLFYFFILGISQSNDFKTLYNFQSSVLYLLIGVCLLCNNYILDAYKSLIIAPVYDNILSEEKLS